MLVRNRSRLDVWSQLCAVMMVLIAILGVSYFFVQNDDVKAAVDPSFIYLGTHPEAAAQSTSQGNMISTLTIKDGKVYMGYGDYGANTGPIHINPYNIANGSFEGSKLEVPTEEISAFRTINNKLYAPMLDPRLNFTDDVGYAEQANDGTWTNQLKAPAVHVFDMATLDGSDLWMVGSSVEPDGSTYRGATAYRSVDGGATWSVVMTDMTTLYEDRSETERYYWVAELNGKIFMQANRVENAPMRSFDGSVWSEGTTDQVCRSIRAASVVVFADNIVCWAGGGVVRAFDGTNYADITPTVPIGNATSFYVDDGYLYVLADKPGFATDDIVLRTSDLESWERVSSVPGSTTSFAVDDDYIYVGTNSSQLLRSSMTISEALTTNSSPQDCFIFESGSNTVTGYYEHEGNIGSNPACPRDVELPSSIAGVPVERIASYAFDNKGLTSVVLPNTITTIGDGAFFANQLTSAVLPNSVTSIGASSFGSNLLTSVTIPSLITEIPVESFSNNRLSSLAIPEGVVTIGPSAFSNNRLESVTIPDSVTTIEFKSFGDNRLETLSLGSGLAEIGESAFGFNRLQSVDLPDSVVTFSDWAFIGQGTTGDDFDASTIYYTRLYTDNPNFTSYAAYEYGENGGGHIINPARLVVSYEDQDGDSLRENQVFAGELDGRLLNDYMAVNGPEITDSNDMSPLQAYFVANDEVTIDPVEISGYLAPSARTVSLNVGDNYEVFTYAALPPADGRGETDSSKQVLYADGELANTGASTTISVAIGALVLMTGGVTALIRKYKAL